MCDVQKDVCTEWQSEPLMFPPCLMGCRFIKIIQPWPKPIKMCRLSCWTQTSNMKWIGPMVVEISSKITQPQKSSNHGQKLINCAECHNEPKYQIWNESDQWLLRYHQKSLNCKNHPTMTKTYSNEQIVILNPNMKNEMNKHSQHRHTCKHYTCKHSEHIRT